MKRTLWWLMVTAGIFGAALAHAGATTSDFTLAVSAPAGSPADGSGDDAGSTLGAHDRASGGASPVTSDRSSGSDTPLRGTGGASSDTPHKAHARSWQSLLPGSIQ